MDGDSFLFHITLTFLSVLRHLLGSFLIFGQKLISMGSGERVAIRMYNVYLGLKKIDEAYSTTPFKKDF